MRAELFADHYSQARLFFRSQTRIEQAHIASAFVFELSKVGTPHIRKRVLANLRIVDEELAQRVADGLAMPLPPKATGGREPIEMKLSPALSIVRNAKQTLEGRKVGILFAEGSDRAEIARVKKAAMDAGATVMLIAPKVGGIPVKGGKLEADGQLAGTPSVAARRDCVGADEQGSEAARERGRRGAVRHGRVRAPESDRPQRRCQSRCWIAPASSRMRG